MIRRRVLPLLVVFSACLAPAFAASPSGRPSTWAVAVAAKAVDNLYRVEPDLYRSARPAAAGFRELQALGVKAVLDVESPGDELLARGSAIKLFHVPMSAFGLRDDRVLAALRIMADPANRPIVVHCHLGADRTGALVALYRVVVEGWSKADAIREMNDGGYHHSSWWRNLDRYVAAADVDALRRTLGIAKPGATLLAALGMPAAASAPAVVTAEAAPAAPAAAIPSGSASSVATAPQTPAGGSGAFSTPLKPAEPAGTAAASGNQR